MDPQSQQPQPPEPQVPTQTAPPQPTYDQTPAFAAPQQPATPPTPPQATQPPVAALSNTPAPITTGRKKFKNMTHEELGKRINILGKILIGLSVVAVVFPIISSALTTGSFSPTGAGTDTLTLVSAFIQALIGAGLLKRNIVAYYAFRVIGILVLISLLLVLTSLPFVLLGLSALLSNPGSFDGLYVLLLIVIAFTIVIYGSVYFFWIYGLFLTNPPKAKELFQKQPPTTQLPVLPVTPPQTQ